MAGVGRTSVLRMSGINSGLDTEAIVEAMTAATKLKITTNQRKVLKLEAQQEAYRGIMDKINEFKSKYFDILNSSSYLKGSSGFNKYAAKISSGGADVTPPGVKVTTNSSAIPGNYKVKVTEVATQSKYVSASTDSKQTVDLDELSGDTSKTFAMKVTVGSQTKVISFQGGTDKDATLANINEQLKSFGLSNDPNIGLVSVVEKDGQYIFSSLEKKAITTSEAVELKNSVALNAGSLKNEASSITVTINGETKTISLATIDPEYYSALYDGSTLTESQRNSLTDSLKNRLADMYQEHLGEKYETFRNTSPNIKITYNYANDWDNLSDTQKSIFNQALAAKQAEQQKAAYDKFALDLYNSIPAGKIFQSDGKTLNEYYVPWNKWLEDFEADYSLTDYVADRADWGESGYHDFLFAELEDEYDDYVASAGADPDDFDTWAQTTAFAQTNTYENYLDDYSTALWNKVSTNVLDKEYDRYLEYATEYNSNLPTGKDPLPTGKSDWLEYQQTFYGADDETKFEEKFLDNIKKHYGTGEIVIAEEELFYNLSYNEFDAFAKYKHLVDNPTDTKVNFVNSKLNATGALEAAQFFNERSVANSINNTTFADGTKLEVAYTRDADGKLTGYTVTAYKEVEQTDPDTGTVAKVRQPVQLAMTSNSGNSFGLDTTQTVANALSTSTKLSELEGMVPDVAATYKPELNRDGTVKKDTNGNIIYSDEIDKEAQYKMTLNGVDFTFDASTTISQMMSRINASDAGVTMTFSSLTNTFEIANKTYGRDSDFTIDQNNQIMQALGFGGSQYEQGKNLALEINGIAVQTASNSYTIDGATFSFNSLTEVGTEFEVEVSRDDEKVKSLIKDFVKDYNELIKFVYGYVDEKPNKDYHFLTDDDKDEMELSDKQEEMWETAAKKGILYNDSTLTTIMSKFRTALYSANTGMEESDFALFSMGITTSSNFKDHGLLVIDEDKFNEAFEKNYEDITRLFTNTTNGIMTQFDKIIESAVKSTGARGERGTLVDKAGVVNGASTTDNTIYNQIKSLNTMIDSLERRYEQQQDRYWKIYTALEQQMGSLNSQTSYISQLMGQNQ